MATPLAADELARRAAAREAAAREKAEEQERWAALVREKRAEVDELRARALGKLGALADVLRKRLPYGASDDDVLTTTAAREALRPDLFTSRVSRAGNVILCEHLTSDPDSRIVREVTTTDAAGNYDASLAGTYRWTSLDRLDSLSNLYRELLAEED